MKYGITVQLPKTNEQGEAIFIDQKPIYETNWFCSLSKHPQNPTIELIEWDTNINYAMEFSSKMAAESYVNNVIKENQGITIKPIIK